MKSRMVALIGIVLASLSIGCAQTKTKMLSPHLSYQATEGWSQEEHRKAADLLHEETVRLEDHVANLEKRVERLSKRPHEDIKGGVKLRKWKSRIGKYNKEILELHEKIDWHHREADRLIGVLPSEEKVQLGRAAIEWSAEEHLEVADLLDEEVVRLEAKVVHLEQRVERFDKKPSMDPKGIKRQEWRELIKANREEILELHEQVKWHHGEAERLSTMLQSE